MPDRSMADSDAALEQKVLDIPRLSEKQMYISTASRMISGDELKYQSGRLAFGGAA